MRDYKFAGYDTKPAKGATPPGGVGMSEVSVDVTSVSTA